MGKLKVQDKKYKQEQLVRCPICQRGDIWQEAVNRTQYVYNDAHSQEVIDYLLAEVKAMLGQGEER